MLPAGHIEVISDRCAAWTLAATSNKILSLWKLRQGSSSFMSSSCLPEAGLAIQSRAYQ